MFNNITIVRRDRTTEAEIQRIKVPLIYAPKDKYVTRLATDPDLLREVQTVLPRMSFELTPNGINYDIARKQNSLLKHYNCGGANGISSAFMGVPYNFTFELNIYSKTIDDGNQIIEQILPYFQPDFTLTVNPIPELSILKDIPIILDDVVYNPQYEGNFDSVRYVYWTLTFTVKGYLFGPISTPKIIRKSIANIFNDPSIVAGYTIKINTDAGNNGTFQMMDSVYQGDSYQTATAVATVVSWNRENRKLIISGAQGQFIANSDIKAVNTNAVYNLSSFDATPLKLASITIEPDPIDAEPGDDYGFTETILEWPDTEPGANT
jgi:hypothetical protein